MKPSELGNEFMNIDGDVLNYEVANGLQNIGNRYVENGLPVNDMSFADGGGDDFYSADGDDEFYNARGGLFKNFRKNQAKRQARRDLRNKSKAELRLAKGQAKMTKADAKVGLAEAQKKSADAIAKGTEGDIAMANALASKPAEKTGMSTGVKVGIAVGVVAVLGIVGYFIYKKMKSGKK
jgi:hypothetical protein